ncbi:MAG: multicopper oxidase domain-containing protein [Patescibacteria group bacterium]
MESTETPQAPQPAQGALDNQQNTSDQRWRVPFVILATALFGVFIYGFYWILTASSGSPIGTGWFVFSFAAGLSMIVLPCTLPLAFVIVPLSMGKGYVKGLAIALAFGLGVAITLSLYGILAALLGKAVFGFAGGGGETIKNIFYALAGVFAMVFALGELGFLKVRMPSYMGAAPAFIQKRQDIAKAFMLGLFLGNIGVGCPHPATPIILGQIGVTGDVFYGWLLFFVHAIGRIIPLLLLAVLGILGINATRSLLKHKDKIARATAWGMVFVGAFLFTLGFFGHAWWVNSGQHTLLEELTQEHFFNVAFNEQFGTQVAHVHGMETGTGYFGLPLWMGNWAFVFLMAIPLWWYLAREQKRVLALPEAERAAPFAVYHAKRWSVLLLTMLLAVVFMWAIPQRFVAQQQEHMESEAAGHAHDTESGSSGITGMDGMHDDMMHEHATTADLTKLPLRTPKDRVARLPFVVREDGVKEFALTAEPVRWEYEKGKSMAVWGYNGQIPGPEIRVTEGDTVRIIFANKLPVATTIHWHGMDVPNSQDGVPGVTQRPIGPGEMFIYEFTAKPAGTRFYHTHGTSHTDEAEQMDMGLAGAFIVEPKGYAKPDREYTLMLDEWELMNGENMAALGGMSHGAGGQHMMNYNMFTINGRAFPDTEPLSVKIGERVLLRLINAGSSATHPMHLHGSSFTVVAVDGNPIPLVAQLTRDTIVLAPGERYDIEFVAQNPGMWVLHCHELHHADMGMIVPVVYVE